MNRHRGFALVMAGVALATAVTSAAAATTTNSGDDSHAGSAKPMICVALIVDARSIGSDVSTSCAKVPKGATGYDVLTAGGHRAGFRRDGLICTIDGLPKGGCSTVDDSHYWAYFHRAPGSTKWVYSSEGATTYQPVNDSTEGWVYDDGKSLTPENVPYDQICTTKASPTPTPTPSDTPSRTVAPTPTATPSNSASASHRSSPPATSTPTPIARHRRHRKNSPTAHPTIDPSPPPPSASPSSAALAGAIKPPSNHHAWLDLLIGLGIVTAISTAAAVRFRRSDR